MSAKTLDDIVLQVGRNLGHVLSGTVSAAGTASLTDASGLIQPSNQWVNHYARALATGEERLIIAHDQASKALTVDPAWGTPPSPGSGYQILPLQRTDIVGAIEQATMSAGESWVILREDTSLVLTAAQEYALPVDLARIWDVYGGDGVYWRAMTNWEIVGKPGSYKLHFRQLPTLRIPQLASEITLSQLRLVYTALPTLLASGAETSGVGETAERALVLYLIEYASYILHSQAMRRNLTGEAARGHLSAADQHRKRAEQIKAERETPPVIRRVRTPSYPRVLG